MKNQIIERNNAKSISREYIHKMFKGDVFTRSYLREAGEIFDQVEHLQTPEKETELVRLIMERCEAKLSEAA